MTKDERFNYVVNRTFGGWHHVSNRTTIQGAVRFSVFCGGLSTYDFDFLTKLVVTCHAVFVRAEIQQSGPRTVAVVLSARSPKKDGDDFSVRHPSLDDLIQRATEEKECVVRNGGIDP